MSAWPRKIFATYQKPIYTSQDRFQLCLFNFVNGFDNRISLEYALAKGALRDKEAMQDIQRIITVLERGEKHLHEWYSFSLVENRWVYLDGSTKKY